MLIFPIVLQNMQKEVNIISKHDQNKFIFKKHQVRLILLNSLANLPYLVLKKC